MPAHIKENFYRCPNCDSAEFIPRPSMVLRRDPDFLYPSDFEVNEAVPIKITYHYFCAKCGQELDRRALTLGDNKAEV